MQMRRPDADGEELVVKPRKALQLHRILEGRTVDTLQVGIPVRT